jgi:hypothetical protein
MKSRISGRIVNLVLTYSAIIFSGFIIYTISGFHLSLEQREQPPNPTSLSSYTSLTDPKLSGENTTSFAKIIKVLLSDVTRSLRANDSKTALIYLNLVKQQLSLSDTSSPIFGPAKVLVNDAIQNLQRTDINAALIHLNLVVQQLDQTTASPAIGMPAKTTATAANTTRPEAMPITQNSLLTYERPDLVLKMQYPSNWSVVQNKEHAWYYQPGGNEVVTFYAPVDKNSSSPVDRYVSVSVFKFQWASPETIKDYADNIAIPDIGADNKLLSSNENIRLAGVPAYQYVYSDTEGHKVMKIAAIKGGYIYEISYTSDTSTYGKSLPTAEKMIQSFQFTKIIPNSERVGSSAGLTNQTAYSITHNNVTSIHQHFNSTQPIHSARIHSNRTMFSGNSTLPNASSPSSHATPIPNIASEGSDGG